MFTHTYHSFSLCIFVLLCFTTSHGDTFRFVREGNYLSQLVQSLNVISIVGENEVKMSPKNGGNASSPIFNVKDYGAKGDGIIDDTKAFQDAWKATCQVKNGSMLVPSGLSFLVQTVSFSGDECQPSITFQVDGKIVAPKRSDWKNLDDQWIMFTGFDKGLTIKGNGVFDGRGEDWWKDVKKNNEWFIGEDEAVTKTSRPYGIVIENSKNVNVTGVTIQNTPQMHIFFSNCQQVEVFNFTVSSPGNSPNTDGIHVAHSQNVQIYNSTLACGDDCVSLQNGCHNITIHDVHCGPGHGFSIGSLGYMGTEAYVSNIQVYNSTATNTSTGARIKTWETGKGTARNITFENIIMSNVTYPIIIDQYYCHGHEFCNSTGSKSAIAISRITYKNITGTYTKTPVALVCSAYQPCRRISMATIDLKPLKGVKENLNCLNAYGTVAAATNPLLNGCILIDEAAAPAPAPATSSMEDMAHNELW